MTKQGTLGYFLLLYYYLFQRIHLQIKSVWQKCFQYFKIRNHCVPVREKNHHIICRPRADIEEFYLQTQKLLVPSRSLDYPQGSKHFPGLYIHCFLLVCIPTCDSTPLRRKPNRKVFPLWQICASLSRRQWRLQPKCMSLTDEIMSHLI